MDKGKNAYEDRKNKKYILKNKKRKYRWTNQKKDHG